MKMRSALVLMALGMVPITTAAPASADGPAIDCSQGAVGNDALDLASPYTVAIDGMTVEPSAPGRYGKYWVLVCKDPVNHDYNVFAGIYDANVSGGEGRFTAEDLDTEFAVSFLPDPGTEPLVAQGHGNMRRFAVDPNEGHRARLVTKPIAYSDIYGSDCGNLGPSACIAAVRTLHGDRASADNIEIRVSIRYVDESAGAGGNFRVLQGMSWSSSAYLFWMNTSCPTNGVTSSAITVDVGGPHFRAELVDGLPVQNFGSVRVFIPSSAVVGCFGAPPSLVKGALVMSRTENGTTVVATTGAATDVGLEYVVTADDASGLTIDIPRVTFSEPKYKVRTRTKRSLARVVYSPTTVLRRARLAKPTRGSFTVSTSTPTTCAMAAGKLFGYRKGLCVATVTTYDKHGTRVAARTVTIKIA